MDPWQMHTPSPSLKFEHSPAESFLSTPGEMYPSLFDTTPLSSMNPLDIMTPKSYVEDKSNDMSVLSSLGMDDLDDSPDLDGDKKPVKKRKSWGQVLPEPKTNLPPRKRAKTEDEKEQRRVERVLRNRRAAQSSRERKRQEVEALERQNKDLQNELLNTQKANLLLMEELNKYRRSGSAGMTRSSPSFDTLGASLGSNSVTLSKQLFGSQDGHRTYSVEQSNSALEEIMMSSQSHNKTVNPASLSPALSPVAESMIEDESETEASPAMKVAPPRASADVTQHPAEMLWKDLQCQSAEVLPAWATPWQPLPPVLLQLFQLQLVLASTSVMLSLCRHPLVRIAISMRAGFSIPPTPAILNTIIRLVTTPTRSRSRRSRTAATSTTSTLTTSSPMTCTTFRLSSSITTTTKRNSSPTAASTTRPFSTLRLKVLQKILTCSPILARPLMDATMAALRLASFSKPTVDQGVGCESSGPAVGLSSSRRWRQQETKFDERSLGSQSTVYPSKEALLTLAWVLKNEQRKHQHRAIG